MGSAYLDLMVRTVEETGIAVARNRALGLLCEARSTLNHADAPAAADSIDIAIKILATMMAESGVHD